MKDLIEETDVLITLSNKGYIKRLDQVSSLLKKRGGHVEFKVRELDDDFVREPAPMIIFFTNKGRVYRD